MNNVFDNPAFSMSALTAAINILPGLFVHCPQCLIDIAFSSLSSIFTAGSLFPG